MGDYARAHAAAFGRVLAMPNTLPPLTTPDEISDYRKMARDAAPDLDVLIAFRLMPDTGGDEVSVLADSGVRAVNIILTAPQPTARADCRIGGRLKAPWRPWKSREWCCVFTEKNRRPPC
jgi:hypothetical protein